ncbi:hypothetical protein E2C01_020952 [Portunus trituberculatus]|uniref:Uncharacterized protein n=1 Tax=Portunus trituberculatus TaxID=210409 RepID=A0A5B7E194_PORTR|nr:hypothetical protein [Portunus trituberculatus]
MNIFNWSLWKAVMVMIQESQPKEGVRFSSIWLEQWFPNFPERGPLESVVHSRRTTCQLVPERLNSST